MEQRLEGIEKGAVWVPRKNILVQGTCTCKGPEVGLGFVGWRLVWVQCSERVGDIKLKGEQEQ